MRFSRFAGLCVLMLGLGLTAAQGQSYSASYKFLKSVKDLDFREIKMAVEKGVNVNTRDYDDKSTPLIIATRLKQESLVNYLLQNGAKPDLVGEDGRTPLVIASRLGERTIVALLIKAGADIDLADSNGATPLVAATMARNHRIVELLLEAGADHSWEDYSGRSPLQHALDNRDRRTEKLLREAGATR